MLLLTEVLSRGWLGGCVGQGYPDSPGDSLSPLRKSYPDLYTGYIWVAIMGGVWAGEQGNKHNKILRF